MATEACPRARLVRLAHDLHQPVGILDAFVELLYTDALVPAVRAVLIRIDPDAAQVIAADAGIARLSIIAETGTHRRYDRHTGPHRVHHLCGMTHNRRGGRRLWAEDRRGIERQGDLRVGEHPSQRHAHMLFAVPR